MSHKSTFLAGRPNASSNASDDEGTKSLNLDQLGSSGNTGKANGFNECKLCNGLTAAACKAANTQICNDSQESCQVEIRSQYKGSTLEHRYYSRCSSLAACNFEEARNFHTDKMYNQCRTSQMAPRFFQQSKCTFCTKMGSSVGGQEHTLLFGSSATATAIYISSTRSEVITTLFTDPQDTNDGFNGFFTQNNWYWELRFTV